MTPEEKKEAANKALEKALRENNTDMLRQAFKDGADPNTSYNFGHNGNKWESITAIGILAYHDNAEGIKIAAAAGEGLDSVVAKVDPLLMAAWRGKWKAFDALLELGRDPYAPLKGYNEGNLLQVLKKRGQIDALKKLDEVLLAKVYMSLSRETDCLVVTKPSGGHYLREIFNFNAGDRITMVLDTADGKAMCMTRQDFADISNKEMLRDMLDKFREYGGKADDGVIHGRYQIRKEPPPKTFVGPS